MTDKERILTHIVSRLYPKYLFDFPKENGMSKFEKARFENIASGDLVLATTSGTHDFTIGFVEQIVTESNIVIKEIGSKRTCNISNEIFYKIPSDLLNENELLEGIEYEVYQKVLKVISKLSYATRFHSIKFMNNKCIVHLRLMFTSDITKTFEFEYSSKLHKERL